jgi:hypothetical protein
MTRIETTAGRRIESAKAMEIMKDFNLLLEEVETLLEEELIAVHFMRLADREKQAAALPMILKMPIRLLVGRKNRTMRQEAILAYAKKKLMELGGERSRESL